MKHKDITKLLLGLLLLLSISGASAIYNDLGNDSCFTIYTISKDNFCPQATCDLELQFVNNCGVAITDADLGVFVKSTIYDKIQPKKVYRWNVSAWQDITAALVQSSDASGIVLGKLGFTLVRGWKDVSIPQGTIRLRVVFTTTEPISGEIIIAGRSKSNQIYVSVLDPIFRSAFYPFDIPANYTTYLTSITGGYCAFQAGAIEGYCDTNYLSPSPNVLKWWNLNVIDNYNSTIVQTEYNDETRESVDYTYGWSQKINFVDTGGYTGTYDVNTYMFDSAAITNLTIYICKDGYTTGNFTTDGNCFLARTYTPAEVSDTYAWHTFSFDANRVADSNMIQVIYYQRDAQTQKKYGIGMDTSVVATKSYRSNDTGTTWALASNPYMVGLKHRASSIRYQYTTDGSNWYAVPDNGDLTAVSTATNQLKIRSWLKRDSTAYDANVDSLDINYINNAPPSTPTITPEPNTGLNWAVLQWAASIDEEADTIQYNLKVGTASGLKDIADINTLTTDYNVGNLTNNDYYWSVKACDDANGWFAYKANCSNWSNEDAFSVHYNTPPTTPTIIAQPNDINYIRSFDWLTSTDGEGHTIRYHINIGTTSGGHDKSDANTYNTDYNFFNLVSTGTYYWRVRACDNNSGDWNTCSNWSSEDGFIVVPNQAPSTPVLIDEPNGYVGDAHLEWDVSIDPESQPITYRVKVGTTSGANDIADANTANLEYTTPSLMANWYYWSVLACDDWFACSNFSSEDTFIISEYPVNHPPSTPTLSLQPDNTIMVRTFDWTTSTDDENDSIRYNITIGTSSGAKDVLDANTMNSYYMDFNVAALNTFYWRVRACDNNSGGYNSCGDWSLTDVFTVSPIYVNQAPSTPTIIPQPDDFNQIRSFDWLASTDAENDTIKYFINVGTYYNGDNKLNATTFNTDYNSWNLFVGGKYYWRVKACDNNSGDWQHCSDWATDDFKSYQTGMIIIEGQVGNVVPAVIGLTAVPEMWGGTGLVWLSYLCYDPNGSDDLNYSYVELQGANTEIITDLNNDGWFVSLDLSTHLTQKGITIVTAHCVDKNANNGEGSTSVSYSPDHKIDLDYGAATTYKLKVDINSTAPLDTKYMSYSCDNNNWSDWEIYKNIVKNFSLSEQPAIGCVPHGEGTYYVYASFSDGLYSYATFDSIEVVAEAETQTPYVNPNESTETTTALFSLAPISIEWGLIVLIVIIAVVAIYYYRKEKQVGWYR